MVYRFLLLPLFLFSFSVTASDTIAPQKPDFLERVIQANQGEYQDPLGLTFEGTIKAAALNTAYYTAYGYGMYVFEPSLLNPDYWAANKRILNGAEGVNDDYVIRRGEEKTQERCAFTKQNARYAGLFAVEGASVFLAYAATRAATKEITGYDAASLVQHSIQSITVQAVGNYVAPDIVRPLNNNQVASFVATDLTIAATMYAYKEMTGKNLRCPKLPIPKVLRTVGINEAWIGAHIHFGVTCALRTHVMDKLCGVPA